MFSIPLNQLCCLLFEKSLIYLNFAYQLFVYNLLINFLFTIFQGSSTLYRHEVINNLQLDHALVILVADNLTTYVDQVRHNPPKVLAGNPEELYPDGRYNHVMQVN